MKVAPQEVRAIAELANLELSDTEQSRMVRDLNTILEYIELLNELDTTGVPPMTLGAEFLDDAHGQPPDRLRARMREDERWSSLTRAEVLQNAPETDGSCFQVPKVLER